MAEYKAFQRIVAESIVDGSVDTADIVDGAISAQKFSNASVGSDQLSDTLSFSGKTVTYRAIQNSDISTNASISASKLSTNAAVDNLGFTPLSTSGDTINGTLEISSSGPAVYFNRTSDTGVDLAIGSNSSEGFSIWEPEDTGGPQSAGFTTNGKLWMNFNDDQPVTFYNGLNPAYESGWIAVNSDDRYFSSDHGLGREPNYAIIEWYDQTAGTSRVSFWGANFVNFNNNDDTDAMAWDTTRWRMGIDDDASYKRFWQDPTNSNSERSRRSDGYGFKVKLW